MMRILILIASLGAGHPSAPSESIRAALAAESHAEIADAEWHRWSPALSSLYAQRDFAPLWVAGGAPTPAGAALLREIDAAEVRGLHSADYRLRSEIIEADEGAIDVALSAVAARFVTELASGRIDPASLSIRLDVSRPAHDPLAVLRLLAESPDPQTTAAILDSLEPPWRRFALLKQALARYRALVSRPDLPAIAKPADWHLRAGDAYAGAASLRRRLEALGDLPLAPRGEDADQRLDAGLIEALRRFQRRHGLPGSGLLDASTYAALQVPLDARVRQLELAMERFRTLPPRLETPPLVVNIPQFRLFAFYTTLDREDAILGIDVIVGRAFAQYSTPILAADMTHVVFRPYWDVPASILERELLPRIRRDPAWVQREGYEIVSTHGGGGVTHVATARAVAALADGRARLRQRPGPANALGLVKFVFPNRHSVLLHDTPADALFAESRRAFSHGCIRVADPVALATYVLRNNPGWTRERIVQAMAQGTERRVDLTRPIRVFLVYSTALATEDGSVYFFADLYGHDARLDAALRARGASTKVRIPTARLRD